MDEFKLCSDGEFQPVNLPCPPPYSGPYYYYPYDNLPLPPEQGISDYNSASSTDKGGAPISSGAVAGIIIAVGFVFFMMCLIALRCRARFIYGSIVRASSRNARNHELAGSELLVNSGDNLVVNIVGCGLEEKLVNLLPVSEYVGLRQEGKLDGKLERQMECAVCLSLFEEKEIVRVLPKCHHIFHIQCIDKWFESHANCPLCRERITLQTIQLCFNSDKLGDDPPQPSDPSLHLQDLAHDHFSPHPFNDQHANNPPPLRAGACVHDGLERLACDDLQHPHPHQNISLSVASAANINNPHTAETADQHARHAAGGHAVAADQKSAGLTRSVQGLSDQDIRPSLPAVTAESMTYKHDAESKQDENACNETAGDACAVYIGDAGSAGPPLYGCLQSLYEASNSSAANDRSLGTCAHQSLHHEADDQTSSRQQKELNKTGDFFNPVRSQQARYAGHVIDDQKTAFANPQAEQRAMSHDFDTVLYNSHELEVSRQLSLLRKSLSTGSMVESNDKVSHALPAGEIL